MIRKTLATVGLVAAFGLAVPAPAAAQPQRGGTLIIGLEGEPGSLVAHLATDTAALMVASNMLSTLFTLNFDFEPVPDLAEKWTQSADGRTYTFQLVRNAKWHDGKPVTARDVEFTFNEVIAKVHPRAASWWPNVEYAKAIDDYTFEIKLKEPYAPFLTVLGYTLGSGTMMLPKHVYQGTDPKTNPANAAPIGSGPFKFKEWVKGSHVELVRNDAYYKPGKPYLDRIIVRFLPDAAARLLAFERGEVDFLHWYIVPHDRVKDLRKDPRFQIVEKGGEAAATNEYLLFNLRNQHLKDVRVRRAIAYALDRSVIQDISLFGEGKPARSFVNSGLRWIFEPSYDVYDGDAKKDLATANKLLDEAGFARGADGTRFSLRVFWASGRDYEGRAAEVIRDQLKQAGIDVKIQVFDRPTFIDRVFRQWDFDLANQLFTTGPDPTISVTPRYHTNQIKKQPFVNGMGYSNPALDKLFDAEFKIVDRKQRADMWRQIQKILMEDLPAVPLFEIPVVNAVSSKFKDVITDPQGYVQSREDAYMVK
ncbi:MAG: ABC transporter substrate-binding protein [Proteobacteria bacterium]|nr:ABC transporter substrate-binding protein [Pseudomonadota bacterium]